MFLIDLIKSKIFIRNLIAAILFISIAFGVTVYSIDKYTDHGVEITIPDLSEYSLEQAKDTLAKYDLSYIVIDSVYNNNVEKGVIIEQTPKAGDKIKKNRTIYVTINAFTKEMIPMPDLVGVSIRQAITDAQNFGVKIGERKYVPDIAKDYVLKQLYRGKEIAPGTKIPKGSYIDLEIGSGTNNEKIPVPNVLGMNLNDAEEKCKTVFIEIAGILYDETVKTQEDTLSAIIYKQSPMPGEGNNIVAGSFIDVWLTTDKNLVPDNIPQDSIIYNEEDTNEEVIL